MMLSFLLAATLLPAQTGDAPAALIVSLPSEARLYVEDSQTRSTGSRRRLETPALSAGRTYYYTVRAEFERDGRLVREEKRVPVRAGQETAVAFFQTVRAAPPDDLRPGIPGGVAPGMPVNPGVPNAMNPGGVNPAFPAAPGGGKIVQKAIRQPNGTIVNQQVLIRSDGSQVILSQGQPQPSNRPAPMQMTRPGPFRPTGPGRGRP